MTVTTIILLALFSSGLWVTCTVLQRPTIEDAKGLLTAVLVDGPGYGLSLAERVREKFQVELHQSVLYPALRELERDGCLVSWDDYTDLPPARRGRPRRMYKLVGVGELTEWKVRLEPTT